MDAGTVSHPQLSQYLEASRSKYDACLDSIEHDITLAPYAANARFHHLKLDANGQPKVRDLANCLADHVIEYCLSEARRGKAENPHEYARLAREARCLFRLHEAGGESGEMLLYFLLECVLGVPQVVSKMDLKTNRRMEVHGSDGIHMRWHADDECLDLYFGEAKLEQDAASALRNAFSSIESFHGGKLDDHECGLITSHFKWQDEKTRDAVLRFVDRQSPDPDCRVNHACLIGYDWDAYDKLPAGPRIALEKAFKEQYAVDARRLCGLLKRRLGESSQRLHFEVFFLPFRTVQEFRDAFNDAIGLGG